MCLKITYIYIMIISALLLCIPASANLDSNHTWVVSKKSSTCDPNLWHPTEYPLNLSNSAPGVNDILPYLQDGDQIYIFPGTYTEKIDLSNKTGIKLIGLNSKACKIVNAEQDCAIKLGNECELHRLSILNTYTMSGWKPTVSCDNKENIKIVDCIIEHKKHTALQLINCSNAVLTDNVILGQENNFIIKTSDSHFGSYLIRGCHIIAKDYNICGSSALQLVGDNTGLGAQISLESCFIRNQYSQAGMRDATAIQSTVNNNYIVNISKCNIFAGVKGGSYTGRGVVCNSGNTFHISGSSVDIQSDLLTRYSISGLGTCYVSNTAFDPNIATGTIIYTD